MAITQLAIAGFMTAVRANSLFSSQSSSPASQDWGLDGELRCQGYSEGMENNELFKTLVKDSNEMPIEISNMTFYRNDWYSYCYNYYEGQFYDYYENYYTKQVNRTKDFLASHFELGSENKTELEITAAVGSIP